MKKTALILSMVLLLSGCKQVELPEVSLSPAPSAPLQSIPVTPEPSEPPLWASLSVEDLPDVPVDLGEFFALSSPQVCLLAQVPDSELTFYGLNPGYGGGILLRNGDSLVHFDQEFGDLPEIFQDNFSGSEETELAVLWPLWSQSSQYDLVFYYPTQENWQSCSVSRDACIDLVEEDLDYDWDKRSHTLTLSFRGQTTVEQFPTDTAPGRMSLGHVCRFYESQGSFFMTMDAWSDVLEEAIAVFRAEVVFDGTDFILNNLQMDSMVGV